MYYTSASQNRAQIKTNTKKQNIFFFSNFKRKKKTNLNKKKISHTYFGKRNIPRFQKRFPGEKEERDSYILTLTLYKVPPGQ